MTISAIILIESCLQLKFQSNILRDINHSRYLGISSSANSAEA